MPDSGLPRAPYPRPRIRLSIVTVLAAGFGALVLAAVASVLAIGLWSASRNTLDLLRDKAEVATEILVMRTRNHLDPAYDQARYLAGLMATGELGPKDRGRMADYLLAAMAATPQVRGLAFIDTDYDVLRAGRTPEGPVIGLVNWSDDPEVRAQMEKAEARTLPYWGELIWSENAQSTLINLRAPVHRQGKFLGVIVAVVTVTDLSKFLTGAEMPQSRNSFILYGGDYVLAHRNMARGKFVRSPRQPLPGLADVGDPVLASIWDADKRSALPFALGDATRGHLAHVGGRTYVFLYRQIDSFGTAPWIVGTYFAEDAALGRELSRLMMAGVGGLAILLLSLVAAAYLGRRLSAPIRSLATAAHGVSGLELSRVQEVSATRVRELDEAATAFNTMLRTLRLFETYVPRALVRQIIRRGGAQHLISREQEVTVLFTDITGFTALVEHKTASEAATILNEHFTLVAGCVEAEDGTIDKYIGDSVMAFWGAPSADPDHAARACRAALGIRGAVALDNEERRRRDEPAIAMRMGIHTGRAIVGNIGAPGRINYTLVGDTVNVAQRVMDLGKQIGGREEAVTILVSDAVAARVGDDFTLVPEGEREVRGRDEDVRVYRLIS